MRGPWAWLMSQRVVPQYRDAVKAEWHIYWNEAETGADAKVAVAALVGELVIAWRSNPL